MNGSARKLSVLTAATMALAILVASPASAQSKVFVNELYRGGTFLTDEWTEVVLTTSLTAAQLEGFYVGDSTSSTAAKFSGYKFTGMSSIASTFPAGTIIVVGGTTAFAQNTAYNPAGGDWNIHLNPGGGYLTANANTGDYAGTDVSYVDTNGTAGDTTISADGFAVNWDSSPGTLGAAANVTISVPANPGGAYLTTNLSGASTPASWTLATTGLTPGQPNGGANTTYIEGLRGSGPGTPTLSINDVTVTEGDSGTVNAEFTVTLSASSASNVTFDIATADNTATVADGDYVAKSVSAAQIDAGLTTYTFTVVVNGDATPESTETFFVNVTNVSAAATLADGQGTGTITNDDVPTYEVFEIQGSGAASPYASQVVRTLDNVVTAVGTQGFFVQTPDARADASEDTSNGIYVYTGSAPGVAVGDQVDVLGTVTEYFNFTEFSPVTSVTVDSSGNDLPAAVQLGATVPPTDPASPWWTIGFERLEGMLVQVASGITSGPNQRFGGTTPDLSAEIYGVASTNRPFREPGVEYPGLPSLPVWDGNPEVFEIDPDRLGAVADPDYVPAGSAYSATGVMAYEFSGWELWPTAISFTPPTMPRPVRARDAGEFTVGTYNLLQLDATASDYTTRLQKHSAYVRTVLGSPDVVGVQECMSITELNALAARLHTDDASLTYTAYLSEGHDVGGIDVGFLVRDTVTDVVVTQLGYSETFTWDASPLHDRPPLLLEAKYAGNGTPFAFTVMVNHTRSLNSIDDPTDGPRVRQKRLEQAQSIAQMIQTYQTTNPLRPFVMVGDLNAYEVSDGYVDVVGQMAGDFVPGDNLLSGPDLVNPNLTKQALNVAAGDRYSYNYEGTAQVLDHALTTQATNTWVRGFAYGRGNTDAAVNLLYDGTTVLRASDHDGAVLFLMSDADGNGYPDDAQGADLSVTKTDVADPVPAGRNVAYTITVTNAGPEPAANAAFSDTLPAGTTFVSIVKPDDDWTCTTPGVGASGTVSCSNASFGVGGAAFTLTVATAPAAGGTVLSNTVTVTTTTTDGDDTNDSATEETTLGPACWVLSTGVTPAGAGSISVDTPQNCAGGWVTGTPISLTATPLGPLNLSGWFGTGGTFTSATANPATFTISGDATVYAAFGPWVAPIPVPIVVGATNSFSGFGFTAGSVLKLFVSTSGGAFDTNTSGWTPTSWSPTQLTWDIPASVPLGQGFGVVQVVNTDEGYVASNVEDQLLYGEAAQGLPTILTINGTGMNASDPSFPGAHVETLLAPGATVTITGTGFDAPLVNLFTATGNAGPLTPLPGSTATELQVVIPNDVPAGPGTFQVVNATAGWPQSNAVTTVLRSLVTVTSVDVVGDTVSVVGDGFCELTAINFFNLQGIDVVNLGGLTPGGTPVIPLTFVDAQHFSFTLPAGAQSGPAYVEALNPPYTPYASSATDAGGAFIVP